jgi:hypothetical protein
MSPGEQPPEPSLWRRLVLLHTVYGSRTVDQQLANVAIPRLLMPRFRSLPPDECCRGTEPSQATRCDRY